MVANFSPQAQFQLHNRRERKHIITSNSPKKSLTFDTANHQPTTKHDTLPWTQDENTVIFLQEKTGTDNDIIIDLYGIKLNFSAFKQSQ